MQPLGLCSNFQFPTPQLTTLSIYGSLFRTRDALWLGIPYVEWYEKGEDHIYYQFSSSSEILYR